MAVQGDFDYSQLTFATASATAEEEAAAAAEDVSGIGDSLEPLLDVLPGVGGGEQAQAAQYAQELMLPGAFAGDDAADGSDGDADALLDADEDSDGELDF